MRNLFFDDGNGYLLLYLDVIGGLPKVDAGAPSLPLGRMDLDALSAAQAWRVSGVLAWMWQYDFDQDHVIDEGEMTQAWLIKVAELRTGKRFSPSAIKTFLQSASLTAPMSRAQSLKGLRISEREEWGIRALLDGTVIGKALVAAVRDVIAPAKSTA